jgi:hypothetical protein
MNETHTHTPCMTVTQNTTRHAAVIHIESNRSMHACTHALCCTSNFKIERFVRDPPPQRFYASFLPCTHVR